MEVAAQEVTTVEVEAITQGGVETEAIVGVEVDITITIMATAECSVTIV